MFVRTQHTLSAPISGIKVRLLKFFQQSRRIGEVQNEVLPVLKLFIFVLFQCYKKNKKQNLSVF